MAEQQEPVRRMVALKIVKAGMDTREVIARFEAERQALALMDHPNIARVLDGGTTSQGRPYFVMDLVKGIPITEFCDQNQLSTEARLKLFVQVCSGVQHAHQKGIIHRDLKPANVLVTIQHGEPLPKVIDFGVAKAIGQKLTERTLFTRFEQLIGTPAYMSPEQAEWSGVDVDTRSDIYSLGVLLYELLTGTTPFDKDTLARAALDEVRRLIRETEPPAPSTRLQGLGQRLDEVAHRRRTEPSLLARLVRGDLDWIVMKSLEKDRGRRYETVNALAQDLNRHIEGEPILARPASRAYRTSRFIRKHRVAVAAASCVALAIIVGLVAALIGFVQARRANLRAQQEASTSKALNDFLLNDLLYQASPGNGADADVKVRDLLDRAATKVSDRFTNQPLQEAAIRYALGESYRWLGKLDSAELQLQRAVEIRTRELGPKHRETLKTMDELAMALGEKPEEAWRLVNQIAETARRTFGPEDDFTLIALGSLAQSNFAAGKTTEAEEIWKEIFRVEQRLYGPEDGRTVVAKTRLGMCLNNWGRVAEAAQMTEEVLHVERRDHSWNVPESIEHLGHYSLLLGDYTKAAELFQENLLYYLRVYGPHNEHAIHALSWLTDAYGAQGQWERSVNVCQETVLGEKDPEGCQMRAAVAALLASDTNAYQEFTKAILSQYAGTTNDEIAATVTIISLLRPEVMADLVPVFDLAARVAPGDRGVLSGNNIAKGIAAYRQGDVAGSLTWFEGWRERAENNYGLSAMSGCFCAMAHFKLGDADAARAELNEAGRRVDAIVHSGEPGTKWFDYGQASLIRAEAERLILGKKESSIATATSLAAARARWANVRKSLTEGDRLALAGKWSAARDEYLAAIHDPAFDWEAAEAAWHQTDLSTMRIAAIFLLAGDLRAHEELSLRLLSLLERHPDPGDVWWTLRVCLAGEQNPTSELGRKTREWVDRLARDPKYVTAETVARIRVMANYRAGRYQEVLDAGVARGWLSHRATWQIFRAMSLAKLARWNEAREELGQAESSLAKPLKNFTGESWWNLALCQASLDEAHRLFTELAKK
jgi:non-specific serine/threonine protein kinase/serine/threonine-protein kinase